MKNREAMMRWGASEEGPATGQVRGVGHSYQVGVNADVEKLMDLGGMLGSQTNRACDHAEWVGDNVDPEMIPAPLPLDAEVITKVGETARETREKSVLFGTW